MIVVFVNETNVVLKEIGTTLVPESGDKVEVDKKFYRVKKKVWDLDTNELRVQCEKYKAFYD